VEKRVTIQSGTPFKILEVKGDDAQLGVKVETPDARPVQVITVSLKPTQAGTFSRSLELRTDNKEQPTVIVPVVAKVVGTRVARHPLPDGERARRGSSRSQRDGVHPRSPPILRTFAGPGRIRINSADAPIPRCRR